jgi:hypothetical protein
VVFYRPTENRGHETDAAPSSQHQQVGLEQQELVVSFVLCQVWLSKVWTCLVAMLRSVAHEYSMVKQNRDRAGVERDTCFS